MSTKIHNAYKYHGSIQELFNDLKIIRKEIRHSTNQFALVVAQVDFTDDDGEFKRDKFYDELERQTKLKHPLYSDHLALGQASVVVYPHNNGLYFQMFGTDVSCDRELKSERFDKLVKSGKIREYHYQNQTDAYFECNNVEYTDVEYAALEEDWERRRIVWNDIFVEDSKPVKAGLTFELSDDYYKIFHFVDENFNKENVDEQSNS